jgi:hypothetical protein
MRTQILVFTLALAVTGCAYPRRTTFMHPAPLALVKVDDRPKGLWTLRVVGAELPPFKATGLPWDSDGTDPDPFVRILIDKRLVWESPVRENNRHPEWNFTLPKNVEISEDSVFRVELWDRDSAVSADPAGAMTSTGLPGTALPDATASLSLDNLGSVSIMVSAPRAQQGVGLRFEVRPDALIVLDVEHYSPAARAGILPGERIVAIGPQRVSELGGDEATSDLSLCAERGLTLTVADKLKHERQVSLDKGFIWLVM